MLKKNEYRALFALAVVVLILIFANMFLYGSNRYVKGQVSSRGQYIQQSLQLQSVYNGLVRNLASMAAKDNDRQLRDLLASQGITFNINSQASSQKGNHPTKKSTQGQ